MTKEQESIVIEELNQLIDKSRDLREEEFYTIFTIHEVQNIETVLNMLKEKDEKIEHQIEKRNNQKSELAILNEKQKKMNKLINNVKSYKGQIKKLEHTNKSYKGIINKKDKEIENKDKIIDLMAEQLAGLTIWNNEKEEPLILADKEEVIKYFEKKRQNVAERKSEEWKLK